MKPPPNVKTPEQYIASLPADRAKTITTMRAFVNKQAGVSFLAIKIIERL